MPIALLAVLVVIVRTGVTEALISRRVVGSDVCFFFLIFRIFVYAFDDLGDHLLQGNVSFHNWVADTLFV